MLAGFGMTLMLIFESIFCILVVVQVIEIKSNIKIVDEINVMLFNYPP